MNFLSILTGAAILAWGTWVSVGDLGFLFNPQGLAIVCGGAFIGTVVAFRIPYLFFFAPSVVANLFIRRNFNRRGTVKQLAVLNDAFRTRSKVLEELVAKSKDGYLKEAMNLLLEGVVPADKLARVLETRAKWLHERETNESRRLRKVARYVWVSGWLAFCVQFISVLMNPPLMEGWGPSLFGMSSLDLLPHFVPCLMSLVYGLTGAFLIVEPLAENLRQTAEDRYMKNRVIAHGVSLIAQHVNPLHFNEELNSYLSPFERVEWKAA